MGLEAASFISQLVASNPPGGDNVSQGDDHLRLLKNVLQGTFPDADRAFYLNKHQDTKSATYTVIGTDDGKMLLVDTSGGSVTINLTAIASLWNGFNVTIMKWTGDANTVTIDPNTTETINGATTIVLDQQYEAIKLWTSGSGSAWAGLIHDVPFLTTRGDLLYYGASGIQRLAVGTSGQVLRSDGTDAVWAALVAGDYPAMVGADGVNPGTRGAVPAPAATDDIKILFGDATWGYAQGLVAFTVFTSSGTWTKAHDGVRRIIVLVQGGGGGGAAAVSLTDATGNRGNGAPGGMAILSESVTAITSRTVTIGAGGAKAGGLPGSGSNGGTTSFGADVTATGGGGGSSAGSSGSPGAGASGDLNFTGITPNNMEWGQVEDFGLFGMKGYGQGGRGATSTASAVAGAAGVCFVAEFGT